MVNTGLIKIIRWGRWQLNHERYTDGAGYIRDAFDLVEYTRHSHDRTVHRPFLPPLKLMSQKAGEPIQTYNDYTQDEYEDILADQIKKMELVLSTGGEE